MSKQETTTPATINLESLNGFEAIELETLTGMPLTALMDAYEGGGLSVKALLAIVYVVRKRTDLKLTFEDVLGEDLSVSLDAFEAPEDPS